MPESLELRDIHLPEPVSWWPPAAGWWLVGITLLLAIAAAAWLLRRRIMATRPRRTALRQLEHIRHMTGLTGLQALNHLLKQVALYKDSSTASYSGTRWTEYLMQQWPEDSAALLPQLADLHYQSQATLDEQDFLRLSNAAKQWIRRQL